MGVLGYVTAWLRSVHDAAGCSMGDRLGNRRRLRRTSPVRPKRRSAMESIAHTLRLGLRGLRRRPSFTLAAVSTLALGIGANTAIFTVANAVLLRPLPYPSADRIVTVWETNRERGHTQSLVAPPTFLDVRQLSPAFSHVVAVGGKAYELTGGASPERVDAVAASPGIFSLLGVAMLEGTGFPADAELPGNDRLVVLSYGFW